MPIVHTCRHPGCPTLTMGDYCLAHETAARAVPLRRIGVAQLALFGAAAGMLAALLARGRPF